MRIEGGTRGETFEEIERNLGRYISLKISAFELYVMRGVGIFEQSGIYSSGPRDVNDLLGRIVPYFAAQTGITSATEFAKAFNAHA